MNNKVNKDIITNYNDYNYYKKEKKNQPFAFVHQAGFVFIKDCQAIKF